MRTLFAIAAACAALSAFGQSVKLSCTVQGKAAGSATFTITPGPDRSYTQVATFKLSQSTTTAELSTSERVRFDGMPISSDAKVSMNGTVSKNVSIQFTTKGATVTDKTTGKKTSYPLPSGTSMKDVSGLWFINIRPHIGSKFTSESFSSDSMSWKQTTRTYVADEKVTVGGKLFIGHKMQEEDGDQSLTMVIDDKGLPLTIDVEGLHFTRSK